MMLFSSTVPTLERQSKLHTKSSSLLSIISKKSLNFENSGVLQSAPEFSRVLKVQRFFADDLNQQKCALCARDIFLQDRMKELNEGAHLCIMLAILELLYTRQAQRRVGESYGSPLYV